MCKPSSPPATPSLLLELAASDDLPAFVAAVDLHGLSISVAAPWYGATAAPKATGCRRMAVEDRTPAMIAALYGSASVLAHILSASPGEARRRSVTDGSTPLHCAAAGGAASAPEVARLIVDVGPDVVDALDDAGRRPADVIARNFPSPILKSLEVFLKATSPSISRVSSPVREEGVKSGEKRDFPPDLTLPDITNGIFSSDEFRMYTFKVRPCSRAYSHDWTECPFVHPGENARRRDPRKFAYSCVPCPEFKKGATCRNGDACEYAHGVFESWLHPAQYRTRLCKDEIGCNRRVCFFAHKPEELRQVNPSAVSVASGMMISSPKATSLSSPSLSGLDMATALMLMQQQPGSPMLPSSGSTAVWMNTNMPPSLQLPGSRLKGSLSARDLDLDLELIGLESYQHRLIDEISGSPKANWSTSNFSVASRDSEHDDLLGSVDRSMLTQLQGLSLKQQLGAQFRSPTGIQIHQSQLLSGYGNKLPSSPPVSASMASSFGADQSMAKTIMNSRASAFSNRSQSFVDRGSMAVRQSMLSSMTTADTEASVFADWGSPTGKLDWGVHGEELTKLRKSVSFNYRNNKVAKGVASASLSPGFEEHNLPLVQSLVTEGPATQAGLKLSLINQQQGYQVNSGVDLQGKTMMSLLAENEKIMA